MNVSRLNTQRINDVGNLCQDPETKGFDLQAGESWIYPTNYPVRDYQYNIIQEALYKNTLVSLPTGLGKTFIAAVVMYNFYRWYPHDKIIFMAPTRPLVKQQMDACYNIMAIPKEVTAELTGTKVQQSRAEIWNNKRVFFITPQVLQNDLPIIVELGPKIKCVVFDEAHRAKGNHAYCEVIRNLLPKNRLFRVLALSATPGNSSRDVIEVMQNLLIARVEFRSEESPDVKPYVFERALETVVVPLGEKLQQIKDQYLQILEKYTRTLVKYKVIYGNCANLTKGRIFLIMKEFQARNASNRSPNYNEIMKSLNICVTLYHAYDTLIRCGLRTFLNFYEEHINNPLLSGNVALRQILEDIKNYLGPVVEAQRLPSGGFVEIPASAKFGHPKFYKLRDILLTHFKNSESSARVIVFFEYRESVSEAYALLSQSYPVISPRVFVGQGQGVSQKDQIFTVKAFREGTINTLLSTSIGEEGLDVGDVDLIVCFDIANKSPIRMIQRMGRTGRKKEGRVVVLVTEGKEQQTLKECLIYKNNLGGFITNTEQLEEGRYTNNPTMIPSYIQPKCQKMFITVQKQALPKNASLKDMLKRIPSRGPKFDDDFEIVEIEERIKTKVENLWDKEQPLEYDFEPSKINFSKHLEKQRTFQEVGFVKHSKQTEIFVSLLQFADSKRFNIPVTQQRGFTQNKFLKQGDIRTMFAKPAAISLSQDNYLPSSQHFNFDKEKDITQSFPAELFEEISAFLAITDSMKDTCKTCDLLFECPKNYLDPEKIDLSTLVIPDLSIVDTVTLQDLEVFADSFSPKSKKIHHDLLEIDNEIFDDVTFAEFLDEKNVPVEETKNKSLKYETPRNFDKILNTFRICEDADELFDESVAEKSFKYETPKSFAKVINLMKTSIAEEPEEILDFIKNEAKPTTSKHLETIKEDVEESSDSRTGNLAYELLTFFKLSSFDDVFTKRDQVADLDETIIYTQKSPTKKIVPCEESPDLFPSSEEKQDSFVTIQEPDSPILCSYERVQALKAKKRLFDESRVEDIVKKPRLSNLKIQRKSFYESTRIGSAKKSPEGRTVLDLSDVCDLSSFLNIDTNTNRNEENNQGSLHRDGVGEKKKEVSNRKKEESLIKIEVGQKVVEKKESEAKSREVNTKLAKKECDLDISDLCDLSIFGLSGPNTQNQKEEKTKTKQVSENIDTKSVEKKPNKELTIDDLCDVSEFFGEPFVVEIGDKSEKKDLVNEEKRENKNVDFSDLDDFCDMSFFMDTSIKDKTSNKSLVDLTQKPDQKTKTNNNKTQISLSQNKEGIIDLTDSDLEPSPVKPKPTQDANKTLSQMSITQMLSLIGKTNNSSQKENSSIPKTKKTQKLGTKKVLQPKQKLESPKLTQRKTNNFTTPKSQKKKINISLAGDSDDEFEDVFKSPIFAKPKPVAQQKKNQDIQARKSKTEKASSSKQPKKRRKLLSEFIDHEAEVSDDECVVVSEDEDSGEDCFEASFVADETQDFLNNTTMQAKYLQSVKSPRRGVFKIPQKFKHNITNVFSQEVSNEDNTYINDSFCVDSEDVDEGQHDLSELEILEMRLKEMKKNKRKKSDDGAKTKRRRIIVSNADSD